MPTAEHIERHFTAKEIVRDIVIGMSDGLTVPFALAAGLTSAATTLAKGTGIIVTAGLAEIAAGSIAMGLGGYLAAKTDSEHFASELNREYRETMELPEVETEEVAKVFREYGLTEEQISPVVSAITADQKRWVDFMMRFELGLEAPDPTRASRSASTIAGSYIVGGLIPLAPYIFMKEVTPALWISVGVTLLALFIFGSIKGHYTGVRPARGGAQTVLVGGLAAAAAFLIARLFT
ncbi:MAG TPA: VIT1/CCC1 transporter family protein [Candidatus Acidoferrum sp.]|nr:VIT1/CCC1 transporter family protein [Candidatus Acidoferrum sp.]